jgi:hypothetical protein
MSFSRSASLGVIAFVDMKPNYPALVLPPPPKTKTKTKTEPKATVALPCSTEYLTQLEETAHSG